MTLSPRISILVIGYNRPQLLEQLLKNLLKFPNNDIFIFIDGANLLKRGDQNLVDGSRSIVNSFKKDYSGDVEIKFNDKNLGCRIGVTSALDWFFNSVEEGIILEDDLILSENFLEYSKILLKFYRDDPRIFSFSGNNFSPSYSAEKNLVFSAIPHVWGWGTWKNRWKLYDRNLLDWNTVEWPQWFREYTFLTLPQKKRISHLFDMIVVNKIDTWDYQLLYTSLKFNFLNIHPPSNLVKNYGFDKSATHTRFKVINPNLNYERFQINELKFVEPIHAAPYDIEYLKQSNFFFKLLFLLRNIYEK